jgi:molybdopterin-guanine dinucleotide biosynthesis protein A
MRIMHNMASKLLNDVAGVILAGGLSRRMGQEKAFVPLAGRPLISYCIEALKPQVRQLAISANGPGERFASYGLPVLADPTKEQIGPLAGLLAALEWAKARRLSQVVTVPVDIPFLPGGFVAKLETALAGKDLACAASGQRRHFTATLLRVTLAADLRKAIESQDLRKVEEWQARHAVGIAQWPSEPVDPFFNINTPEDLAEAERLLRGESH